MTGAAGQRASLITGGAGFIGSHLAASLLARGDRVVVVDDFSTGRRENLTAVDPDGRIEVIEGEVGASGAALLAAGPFDEVYHLAAAVGVDLIMADPVRAMEVNVEQTGALLRELASLPAMPRVLIASSSEVYGKPSRHVFSEDDDVVYGPTTMTRWSYAASKALDEFLGLGYSRSRGLPVVIARFFNTVGPRQVGRYGMVLPRFVAAALRNERLRVFGTGEQTRCFCDVRDVAGLLPRLIENTVAHGRVFNVGHDRPVTIRGLAEMVIERTGSESEIELVPYEDAYPIGYEDLAHRRPDLARLREAVGFEPAVTLEQTIDDVAAWLRVSGAVSA